MSTKKTSRTATSLRIKELVFALECCRSAIELRGERTPRAQKEALDEACNRAIRVLDSDPLPGYQSPAYWEELKSWVNNERMQAYARERGQSLPLPPMGAVPMRGGRFRRFPFASPSDQQIYRSLWREIESPVDRVRLVVIAGPAGTGKTLLAQRLAQQTLRDITLLPAWSSEAEMRKQLPGLLSDGVAILDNIPRFAKPISNVLEAFVSSPIWSSRPLGTTGIARINPKGWLIITTPNENLLTPDLERRAIIIRLKGKA